MTVRDVVVAVLTLVGALFVFLAGVGVIRFGDLYARMHAGTKASTIGIGLIGIGGAVAVDGGAGKTLLAVAIIFVTTPSAAHFIGRSAYRVEGIPLQVDRQDDLAGLLDGDPDDPAS